MRQTGDGQGSDYRVSEPRKRPTSHSHGEPLSLRDWDALLLEFPTLPGDAQAIPEPSWDVTKLDRMVRPVQPRGEERAITRYQRVETDRLTQDAALEGFAFTEPEIHTLLRDGHVPGHTEGEQNQVLAMTSANRYMVDRVREAVSTGTTIDPNTELSNDIHLFIAQPLGLKSTEFRGDQREQYAGPIVRLDRGETYRALDARLTHDVLDDGLARIKAIAHPVLRGATWAAFSTYHQFYLDGNKRTGRYTMNAVLMTHGYDAITVRNAVKEQYVGAVVESYRTADLTPHIEFLVQQYDDSHPKDD